MIGNNEVTSRVVEGEEEAQFWKEANEKRATQRTQKSERYAGGKRRGSGKRGGRVAPKRKRDQS